MDLSVWYLRHIQIPSWGAQMMCPRATDMIGEIATAIANGLSAEEMSFAMRAQPTYNEGIGAAIEDAMRKK